MSTATTERKSTRTTGFKVPCPSCGNVADPDGEGGLVVQLADLTITCPSCDETITREDLARMIADATRLLAWLDLAATV